MHDFITKSFQRRVQRMEDSEPALRADIEADRKRVIARRAKQKQVPLEHVSGARCLAICSRSCSGDVRAKSRNLREKL